MTQGIKNTLLIIFSFIALMLGMLIFNMMTPKSLSAEGYKELGYYGFPEPREILPFKLTDQLGQPVGLTNLKGQWTVLFFGFTYCPDVCPTTLGVLNRAAKKMAIPPQVVLVSVDPERDTPAQLAAYLAGFNTNFKGYTGTFDDLVGLATNVNIAFGKIPGVEAGTYTMDHSASMVVVDPFGRYAGFIKSPHQASKIQKIIESLRR
ncbi:MAG: protein SCO1/2 [Candidatus Pseudothioglobus sp.]|mgnify:CR=1 FL=1|jgi:protein SCO1/2